jgi:hypothetical protein
MWMSTWWRVVEMGHRLCRSSGLAAGVDSYLKTLAPDLILRGGQSRHTPVWSSNKRKIAALNLNGFRERAKAIKVVMSDYIVSMRLIAAGCSSNNK